MIEVTARKDKKQVGERRCKKKIKIKIKKHKKLHRYFSVKIG
jgi:hypothetical protein